MLRITSFFLCLALGLCACGGSDTTPAATPAKTPEATSPPPTTGPKAVTLPPANGQTATPPITVPTELPPPVLVEATPTTSPEDEKLLSYQDAVEAINSLRDELRKKVQRVGQVDSFVDASAYYDRDELLLVDSRSSGPWGMEHTLYYFQDGVLFYVFSEEHLAADMNNPSPNGDWYETEYGLFFDEQGTQLGGHSESDDPSKEIDEAYLKGILEQAKFIRDDFAALPFDGELPTATEAKAETAVDKVALGEVVGEGVRLRDAPSLEDSIILGNLLPGESVQILERSEKFAPWVRVSSESLQKVGWMHGDYLNAPELPAPKDSMSAAPIWTRLANMSYPSTYVFGGNVKLRDGKFEDRDNTTFVQLGPEVYEGDLDGDGDDDAVVLISTNTGGSGMFLDIYAMENRNGVYVFGGSQFLGDRIKINGVRIENGNILVDMITHGQEDPMCCPTHPFVATLKLMGSGSKPSALGEIKVTNSGVGSINENTPFNLDLVKKEFPAFDVEPFSSENENGMQESILISHEGQIVAEVFSDGQGGIYSIVFSGGHIVDLNGVGLGSVFTDNPLHKSFAMLPGMEELSGYIVCETAKVPMLRWVYVPMHYDGPDGALPPLEKVETSILKQLVWRTAAAEYIGGSVPDADQTRVAVDP